VRGAFRHIQTTGRLQESLLEPKAADSGSQASLADLDRSRYRPEVVDSRLGLGPSDDLQPEAICAAAWSGGPMPSTCPRRESPGEISAIASLVVHLAFESRAHGFQPNKEHRTPTRLHLRAICIVHSPEQRGVPSNTCKTRETRRFPSLGNSLTWRACCAEALEHRPRVCGSGHATPVFPAGTDVSRPDLTTGGLSPLPARAMMNPVDR
jgi:hypothetical protein